MIGGTQMAASAFPSCFIYYHNKSMLLSEITSLNAERSVLHLHSKNRVMLILEPIVKVDKEMVPGKSITWFITIYGFSRRWAELLLRLRISHTAVGKHSVCKCINLY